MIDNYYYHGLMKKYVTYFGTLFNDITIIRTGINDETLQSFVVPISYSPKHKFIERLEKEPDPSREVSIILPRMAFEVIDLDYDPQRKLQTNIQYKMKSPVDNAMVTSFAPVPFNIKFLLTIASKNAEDGFKILEQILPYFTPDWTSTLNLIPELDLTVDIPVVLDDLSVSDRYESTYESIGRRNIYSTIQFVMKGFFFGPISNKGIIKRAEANIYASTLSRAANLEIVSYISNFQKGNEVYQLEGFQKTASGVVNKANSSFVQVFSVLGEFSNSKPLLCANSNAIGTVLNIVSSKLPTETIVVVPTLTANGNPTSNTENSISIDNINVDDNYGVNVSIITTEIN